MLWIVWNLLSKKRFRLRDNINITKQIDCLYQLFTQDYTHGKRNGRSP